MVKQASPEAGRKAAVKPKSNQAKKAVSRKKKKRRLLSIE